jgi:hypothetical protein
MVNLRRCACGADPEQLVITEGSCSKYAWAACDSCGEWSIEFRTNYSQDPAELQQLAAKAWNAASRDEFPLLAPISEEN